MVLAVSPLVSCLLGLARSSPPPLARWFSLSRGALVPCGRTGRSPLGDEASGWRSAAWWPRARALAPGTGMCCVGLGEGRGLGPFVGCAGGCPWPRGSGPAWCRPCGYAWACRVRVAPLSLVASVNEFGPSPGRLRRGTRRAVGRCPAPKRRGPPRPTRSPAAAHGHPAGRVRLWVLGAGAGASRPAGVLVRCTGFALPALDPSPCA